MAVASAALAAPVWAQAPAASPAKRASKSTGLKTPAATEELAPPPATTRVIDAVPVESPAPPAPPSAPRLVEALPPSAPRRFHLAPALGFGAAREVALHDAPSTFSVGLFLGFDVTGDFSLLLQGSLLDSRRAYLAPQLDPASQQASRAAVAEQRWAGDLLASFQLLRVLGVTDSRAQLAVVGGPSTRAYVNDAFQSVAAGVGIGGRFRWLFSAQLDVTAGGLWTYNLAPHGPALASALGGPVAVSTLDGSLGLRLSPDTRLGLGYAGEILTLEHSYRLYHSLTFALELAL